MKAALLLREAALPGLSIPAALAAQLAKLEIVGVSADSRRAKADTIFVALTGGKVDGHDYIADAVARGCRLVVVAAGHRNRPAQGEGDPICLELPDCREALGRLAAALNGQPARKMVMIGITGTNGKTTTSYLLEDLIRRCGGEPGVIGTVNYRYRQRELPATHTTPEPETLQRLLAEMAAAGVTHVVMEVSSHALEQRRVAGIGFDVALFTNLSHDHLDYHGGMESYYACKRRLFSDYLKPGGAAVVVAGDDWNQRLAAELLPLTRKSSKKSSIRLLRCGFAAAGELRVDKQRIELNGLSAQLSGIAGVWQLNSSLVGEFNLSNLLGVAGVALALGFSPERISAALALATPPPGRLERFSSRRGVEVFVDYAHTPDALGHVLGALRPHADRLVVIFGCGGDRDRAKRPLMGEIAGRLADIVILTSDNPRGEKPEAILAAIEAGVKGAGLARCRLESLLGSTARRRGYDLLPSRRRAIRDTLYWARPGDLVLLAGKGHETTQVVGSTIRHFDDRQEVAEQLAVLRG